VYIENLGIDEKEFRWETRSRKWREKKGKELIAPGDYYRLFNVRWLACFRSRYSLLCKTTRRREVETFIGFHDSTSEYASERLHR